MTEAKITEQIMENRYSIHLEGIIGMLLKEYREALLQQCSVSGWLELAEQQPNDGALVVLCYKGSNRSTLEHYEAEKFPDNLKYSYRWIPVPAIR